MTPDQSFLKIHEEVGELTKAYLKYSGVCRNEETKTKEKLHKELSHELADLVGFCLLFAKRYDIDLHKAIDEEWLKWLEG